MKKMIFTEYVPGREQVDAFSGAEASVAGKENCRTAHA